MITEPIQEILAGITLSRAELARLLGVHEKTIGRWYRGETAPPPGVVGFLAVLAGRLPFPAWAAFEVRGDRLYAPGCGRGVSPAEVAALPFILQELEHLKRCQAAPAQYLLDLE